MPSKTQVNQSNLLTPESFKLSEGTPQLAYRFRLIGIIDKTLKTLKKIIEYSFHHNKSLSQESSNFPYNESFFNTIIESNASLKIGDLLCSYIAIFNDIPVGAICSVRKENTIFLTCLCVLPAYRRHGIAKHMIQALREKCRENSSISNIQADFLQNDLNDKESEEFLSRVGFRKEGNTFILPLKE